MIFNSEHCTICGEKAHWWYAMYIYCYSCYKEIPKKKYSKSGQSKQPSTDKEATNPDVQLDISNENLRSRREAFKPRRK